MLYCFDEIRAQAKDNLAEPGFRPGEIPPWIKTQMVEFSLTSVMEDVLKYGVESMGCHLRRHGRRRRFDPVGRGAREGK